VGVVLLALILVPFALLEDPMASLTARGLSLEWGGTWGVGIAIALLLAVDVLLPIPSSIVGTSAGYLLGIAAGATASFAGMTLGCLVGYVLGARAGTAALKRMVTAEQRAQLEASAARQGDWVLAVSRPVPVLAEASVIMAGAARMPFRRFFLVTGLANLGISLVYATAGALSATVGTFFLALAAALALPFAVLAVRKYVKSGS
jgi:uncharacterized membrane protein YdjX (TVP38/TMEM64 family)